MVSNLEFSNFLTFLSNLEDESGVTDLDFEIEDLISGVFSLGRN